MKKILFLVFLFLFPFSSVLAYDYPIGIPHPWIEPDIATPARPADWSSEIAGYYYINYQTGSDSYTYGTPTNPRATIPNPVPAGAYLEVHGIYNYITAGDIEIYPQGTSAEPAWLVGIDGDKPIFKDAKLFVSGSYLYIDNIIVDNNVATAGVQFGSASSGYPADHIMIRNSTITGSDGGANHYGISVVGSSDGLVSNIIVYNTVISYIGWDGPPAGSDYDSEALSFGDYCSYAWALDNTMHHIAGGGASVGSADTGRSSDAEQHHQYYGRNEIYATWAVGIVGKYFTDVVISENNIHDLYDTSWSPSKCLGKQYGGGTAWYLFNTLHDSPRFAIRYPGKDSTKHPYSYVIGNLIYNINSGTHTDPDQRQYPEAAIMLFGSEYNYIVNNTIYNAYAGIELTGDSQKNNIENNIIMNTSIHGNEIWTYDTSDTVIRNNIIRSTDDGEKIKWGGSVYTISQLQSNTSTGQNCITSDPQFVDLAGHDFHLQSTSPARDSAIASASLDTDVYALYQSTFGVDLKKDIENHTRPQGSAWDIGAYEYVSTGSDTTPPIISSQSPTGTLPQGTTETTLSITTNENATCKYGTTPNIIYNDTQNTFSTTGGTTHTQTITGLSNGSTYNYYIRCKDTNNNENTTDIIITFSIANTPTIRADVNQDSSINTTDALLILRNTLGLSMTSTAWQDSATTGDVNCDGSVNLSDVTLLLRYSLGMSMTGAGWCEGN